MAKRSGGATRALAYDQDRHPAPASGDDYHDSLAPELTSDLVVEASGIERGTAMDWQEREGWGELFDDPNLLVHTSERVWVREVEKMLDQGGQPAAVEKALTLPIRAANLTIEKPEKDKGQTEFVRDVLFSAGQAQGMKPDLVGVVSQVAQAIAVRKTFHELVWEKRPDGKFGYASVAWRPPSSCEVIRDRRSGRVQGFRQFVDQATAAQLQSRGDPRDEQDVIPVGNAASDEYGYVRIPSARAMIYVHGQHRDPINGVSDLSVTHWAWKMQQKILLMWATFLDGQSQPKVLAYGQDEAQARKTAQTIASLRGSGVVGLVRDGTLDPATKLFEILETSGAGAGQFIEMITYLEQQMSKSVLAGFLDLTSNATRGVGSYALSADQSGLFLTSRQSAAKEIAATITDQLIAPLVRVNFGVDAAVPRLVFEKMSADQNTQAMQMLQQLGSAQNMSVPPGFLDLLIDRVSQYLDLPDEKVEKMLTEHAEQRAKQAELLGRTPQESASPNGQLTDKVNAAGDMIAAKQQTGQAPTQAQLNSKIQRASVGVEAIQDHRQEKQ